jgi:hypothetical protein
MFTLDVLCVNFMVLGSGGARASPFSPIYFILPALAIFLRESPTRIWFYLILVLVVFSLTFIPRSRCKKTPTVLHVYSRIGSYP